MSTRDFQGSAHAFRQLMLFAAEDIATGGEIKPARLTHPETIANPLCLYQKHCGRRAIVGPRVPWADGTGYNETLTALGCTCHGERSTKTI